MKTPRGYLLIEVTIGGVLTALLIAGLLTQVADSRLDNVIAGRDVVASVLLTQRIESERARGFGFAGCALDGTTTVVANQQGAFRRTCTRTTGSETIRGVTVSFDQITVTVEFDTHKGDSGLDTRSISAISRVYQAP